MARGKDVYFAAGKYDPQSTQGKRLLAHELAHTVQDGAAPKKQAGAPASEASQGVRRKARTSAPGDATERQADAAADQVVGGQQVTALGGGGGQAGAVKRDAAVLKQDFATRLVELGTTIGGWEALLEQLDGSGKLKFDEFVAQFVAQFVGKPHGAALLTPLMDDPASVARTVTAPLSTFDVETRLASQVSSASKRWKTELEQVKVAGADGEQQVQRPTLSMSTSEWEALQLAYAASSMLLWAQRHHKGTGSLAELLASDKVKPLLDKQLAVLRDKAASDALGSFSPWTIKREGDQVTIGSDPAALAKQLELESKLTEWFVGQHDNGRDAQWGKNLTERLVELEAGYVWADASVASARCQQASAHFIDQLSARLGDEKPGSKTAVDRVLKNASLVEPARLHLLGLIAADVRQALTERLPDGPSSDESDSGMTPYQVSLREAIAQQVRVEKISGGHGVVVNVPTNLFGRVDALLDDRLPAVDKYFVDDRIAAFEAAQPGVLAQGGYTKWVAREVADRKRLRERVARAAVLEPSARPDKDLLALVNTRGNPIRHRTLNPLGGHMVAALRSSLAKFVAETDGVDAERTRYEVDSSASDVGELMIAGLDADAEHPVLVKAVADAKHTLAGNVGVGSKEVTGVVAFMLDLGLNKKCGDITLAEFKDASNPVAWDYKLNGKRHNKKWLKDKFRAAERGHHEWIPSNLMLKMIERADKAGPAIEAAKWVLVQHWLRSPTTQIIFEPSRYSDEWKAFQDADMARRDPEKTEEQRKKADAHLAKMIETVTTASKLGMSGHIGALYILDNGNQPMQVNANEGDWHKKLRQIASRVTSSSEKLVKELRKGVIGNPNPDAAVERLVWSGSLKTLPGELQNLADVIASDYYNGAKLDDNRKLLAETLEKLAARQRLQFAAIDEMFAQTGERLEAYG